MNREVISKYQAVNIMCMFILGTSFVLGPGAQARQDIWLSVLTALIAVVPLYFLYSKILALFPGKDMFDIFQLVFGKYAGGFIILLYVWYLFHQGALVLRSFSEFIEIVAIPATPQFIIILCMGILCIWMNKAGIEVLGRWAALIFPLMVIVFMITLALSVPKMSLLNMLPVLERGFKPVFKDAFVAFTYPFAEMVAFLVVLDNLKSAKPLFKIYFISLLIGGGMILLVSMRNILVLGVDLATHLYFPSYSVGRLINMGDFLQRIEIIVSINFIFSGIVKTSICLYGAGKGLAKALHISDYKSLVVPLGLLMIDLAILVYHNVMEMFEWGGNVYPFYVLPFQVMIPLILFATAKVRLWLNKSRLLS